MDGTEDRDAPRLEAAIRAVDIWRARDLVVTPMDTDDEAGPTADARDERHFLVDVGGEAFALRLGSPSGPIAPSSLADEVHVMRAAAAAGVAPEVIEFFPQLECLVTRSAPGRPITPRDIEEPGVLAAMVGSIRALHACPLPGGVERSVFRDAEELRRAAIARGASMPKTEPEATEAMPRIEAAIGGRGHRAVACHGNLAMANVLLDDGRVWIVDYRHAGVGDELEDLGGIAASLGLTEQHSDALLFLYFGGVDDELRGDLAMARAAADYVVAMSSLARPTVVTHMRTVESRLAGVVAEAVRAGVA